MTVSREILRLVQHHVTDDDDRYTLTAALNEMAPQSLEELIQEINGAGWQVSTFSQFVESGIWMASVRDPKDPLALGIAQSKDPYAALRQAWTTRRVDKPEPRAFTAMVKAAMPERVRIRKKP